MKRVSKHTVRLSILGTVSAVTFMAMTSSSMALMAPTMNFGLLQPQDQWKVGTVNASGNSYCAMVNKFEKRVVLAFARSAQGNGSLAIDFRESFFEPGAEYDAILSLGSQKAHKFSARASSDRSVVIQIGQDHQFFEALSGDGNLELSLPTIDASFALRKFAGSYKNLDDCASKITASNVPAVKVKEVEQAALAPIDEEVQKLSQEREQLASARAEVEQMRKTLETKNVSMQEMEGRLKQEAAQREADSQKKIADLDAEKARLTEQLAAQKAATVEPAASIEEASVKPVEEAASKPARKLLASTSETPVDITTPVASGTEAKMMEQSQIVKKSDLRVEEDAKKAQALEQAMAAKQKEIETLQASHAAEKDKQTSEFKKKDAELIARLNEMQSERQDLEKKLQAERAEKEKAMAAIQTSGQAAKQQEDAIKANLVSTQAQIAELNKKREEESSTLNQKLSSAEAGYQQKIAALQSAHQAELAKLEERLKSLEMQRQAEMDLAEKSKAELEQTRQQLATAKTGMSEDQKRLSDLQSSLSAQKAELDKRAADLGAREQTVAQKESGLGAREQAVAQKELDLQSKEKNILASNQKTSADDLTATALADQLAAQTKELETARDRIQVLEEQNKQAQTRISELQDALDRKQIVSDAGKAVAIPDEQPAQEALTEIVPASGEVAPEAKVVAVKEEPKKDYFPRLPESMKIIWDDRGYARKSAEQKVEDKKADVTAAEMPAVPNEPVAAQELASVSHSPNRAAAFLEGIMGYHRGTTSVSTPMKPISDDTAIAKQAAPVPQAPVAAPENKPVIADMKPQEAPKAEAPKAAPVAQTAPVAPAVMAELPVAADVKEMEPSKPVAAAQPVSQPAPAAMASKDEQPRPVDTEALTRPPFLSQGPVSVPPAMSAEAKPLDATAVVAEKAIDKTAPIAPSLTSPSADVKADVLPVQDEPAPALTAAPTQPPVSQPAAPVVAQAVVTASTVTVEQLLAQAGFSGVEYTPVVTSPGEAAKQWVINNINGMFEQTSAAGGNFDAQIQTYLDRYREDCPGHLQAQVAPVEASGDLRMTTADIACSMQGNSYVSSFVFAEDSSSFSAVMHSATTGQQPAIQKMSADIARALKQTKGLSVQYSQSTGASAAPVPSLNLQPEVKEASPAAPVQLRFNMKNDGAADASVETAGGQPSSDDDFKTVVVQ